jgi:hypothetical protein
MTQKELIGVFKGRLQAKEAPDPKCKFQQGRFPWWPLFQTCLLSLPTLLYATAATNKKRAKFQTASPVPLYQSGGKMGTIRYSKISQGKEGKKMVRKTETTKALTNQKCCPFHFTFKYKKETNS